MKDRVKDRARAGTWGLVSRWADGVDVEWKTGGEGMMQDVRKK